MQNAKAPTLEIDSSSTDFHPKPKRQGVRNYPASTFIGVYNELKSIKQVAARLNVSYTTVLRYLRSAGIYKPKRKPNRKVNFPLGVFVRLRRVDKLTIEEIAKALDVSQKTVSKKLKQAGYRVGKVRSPKRELYITLQKQGLSNEEIAEQCGVLPETVRQMLINRSGGAMRTRRIHASARRYMTLFKAGRTIREIASECGTAYVTVAKSLRLHGMTKSGVLENGVLLKNETVLLIPSFSIDLPAGTL